MLISRGAPIYTSQQNSRFMFREDNKYPGPGLTPKGLRATPFLFPKIVPS
jgi:hypothetical protein